MEICASCCHCDIEEDNEWFCILNGEYVTGCKACEEFISNEDEDE